MGYLLNLMTDIFTLQKNPYPASANPSSEQFGIDQWLFVQAIFVLCGTEVPIEIKHSQRKNTFWICEQIFVEDLPQI